MGHPGSHSQAPTTMAKYARFMVMSDELKSIDYRLGKIFGKLEGIESNVKEMKEAHQSHQVHCQEVTGKFNERIDKLEGYNDKLTAKMGMLGVLGGALVLLGKALFIPILKLFERS